MAFLSSARWQLKKEAERKFRSGHPWVFSNELGQSPKALPAGALVDLCDAQGRFLARGYGHPNSLISFRLLTRRLDESIDAEYFTHRLRRASRLRRLAGIHDFSHRLCFAEGDGIPGLIIDRYRLADGAQVFVVQSSTAGLDQLLPQVFAALEALAVEEGLGARTAIVLANDSKSRAMEGVKSEPKHVVRGPADLTDAALSQCELLVQPGAPGLAPVKFRADLIGGQKTGFFLDQRFNVAITSVYARELVREKRERGQPFRVLDLCSYIGQWGTQLAHLATSEGVRAEVTLADASQRALDLAKANVETHGGEAVATKMDVLDDLASLPERAFDVVICDPPAFIKKKKDLPTGSQAYLKMNREAIKRCAPSALFVSCSCSGLFTEEDFREMLAKAQLSAPGEIRWLARGGHSADHPQRPEFPQGTYLKAWMGITP